MSWTVSFNSLYKIMEIVYAGKCTEQDLQESTAESMRQARKQSVTKTLVDATDIELAASSFDIYNLVSQQYVVGGMQHKTKIALTVPESPKEKENISFYETVCHNRGWNVRLFSQREDAIEWLTDAEHKAK